MKPSNILLLSALSFISGAMLAVFLLMNVLGPKEANPTAPSQPVSTAAPVIKNPVPPPASSDLKTEINPHSLLAPVPRTSNLPPRPEEFRQIIDLLRSGFLDSASLIGVDLNEQNVTALMEQLTDKIKLSEEAVITPDPKQGTLLELLPGNIGYWRPAEFSSKETGRWITQWEQWAKLDFEGLILDLRHFKDANDLPGAVSLAGLFIAPQTTLFTVEGIHTPQQIYRTEHQPLEFKKPFPLLVLINENTRGTGEALAWSLRQWGGAILIGQPTAGEGGLFTETRLKSGRFLRMASARIISSTNLNLLGTPLSPDIYVTTQVAQERTAFFMANRSNLSSLIAEKGSFPQRNQGETIDAEWTPQNEPETKPVIRDFSLQRAVDVLRGIVLNRRKPDVQGG
jgi:hypothetical protein